MAGSALVAVPVDCAATGRPDSSVRLLERVNSLDGPGTAAPDVFAMDVDDASDGMDDCGISTPLRRMGTGWDGCEAGML